MTTVSAPAAAPRTAAGGGAVSAQEFRHAMGHFLTGVAVVTARDENGPHGTTVNSLTSVSLDPALVLVCLTDGSRSAELLLRSGAFAVNVLSSSQQSLGAWFASRDRGHGPGSFDGIGYRDGVTGSPLLLGAVAQIECRLHQMVPGGDHTIFIGEVVGLDARSDHAPLAFHRGKFLPLAA